MSGGNVSIVRREGEEYGLVLLNSLLRARGGAAAGWRALRSRGRVLKDVEPGINPKP